MATDDQPDWPEGIPDSDMIGRILGSYAHPADAFRFAPRNVLPEGLPDVEGAEQRARVNAAQPWLDKQLDRHDATMRNYVEQAAGAIPGASHLYKAYQYAADPEHPITRSERDIPSAIGYGIAAAAELGAPFVAGQVAMGKLGDPGILESSTLLPQMSYYGLHAARSSPLIPDYTPPSRLPEFAGDKLHPLERHLPELRVHDEPIETYHGTMRGFDTFDKWYSNHFGIHSGTPRAAAQFTPSWSNTSRILPLKVGEPDRPFTSLEVRDLGGWHPGDMAKELNARGLKFTPQELDRLFGREGILKSFDPVNKAEGQKIIEEALNRHGVDLLRYKNAIEDPGSTSYISWNPGTIHSRTTGSRLFGLAGAAAPIAASPSIDDMLSRYNSGQN